MPSAATATVWWFIPSCIGNATNAHYRIVYNGGSNTYDQNLNQNNYSNLWVSVGSFQMNANSTNDYSGLTSVEPGVAAGTHQLVWDDADYETP